MPFGLIEISAFVPVELITGKLPRKTLVVTLPPAISPVASMSPPVVKLPPATLPVAVIVVPPTIALVESILSAFT